MPWALSSGMIPSVDAQNMAHVPATSAAIPGRNIPQPSMDCIVSPAPAHIGVPAGTPVRSAISLVSPPTMSQGFRMRGIIDGSMPRIESCSSDHLLRMTSYPSPHPDMAPWSMKASSALRPARCIRMYGALWTNFTPSSLNPGTLDWNHLAKSAGNMQLASALPVSSPQMGRPIPLIASASSCVRESR